LPEENPEPSVLAEHLEMVEVPVREGERVVEEGERLDAEGEHLDEEGAGDEVAGNLIYPDADNIQERQFPLKELENLTFLEVQLQGQNHSKENLVRKKVFKDFFFLTSAL
jgi:hypothetical protein